MHWIFLLIMDELGFAKKPDRLDIYLDYMNPDHPRDKLPSREKARLDLMMLVRGRRKKLFGPAQVLKMLMNDHGQSQSNAYQIMADSDFLFGGWEKINKSAERSIIYENLHFAMQIAMADKEAKGIEKAALILKINAEMAKIADIHNMIEQVDVDKLMPATTYIIMVEPEPEPQIIEDGSYTIEEE